MKRAQSAVEFTLITTIMLLLFSVGFVVVEARFLDVQQDRLDAMSWDLLETIEAEIQIAWEIGDGYERTFYLPRTLQGVPYEIQFNDATTPSSLDELVLTVKDKNYLRFVPYDFDVSAGLDPGSEIQVEGGDPVTLTST